MLLPCQLDMVTRDSTIPRLVDGRWAAAVLALLLVLTSCSSAAPRSAASSPNAAPSTSDVDKKLSRAKPGSGDLRIKTVAGMPPVHDPTNLYSDTTADHLAPATKGALRRVYVPNGQSGTVSVIDPATMKVVDTFDGGRMPQHIVPAYDLKRLWVLDNSGNKLIPIDPNTARPGPAVPVDDPYNLYFTPDGAHAIVVAERERRLDFRAPQTMELQSSLPLPCKGINHMDFSIDGRWAVATCEFAGSVVKIDMVHHKLVGVHKLFAHQSMPQDVRISPDGTRFFVADMMAGGVWILNGGNDIETQLSTVGFVPTGTGAHGLYPSRDGRNLYVTNRGWATMSAGRRGPGGVSVLDFATSKVVANWPVPGGGSPDMGNLNADGTQLWLSGRYDSEVYAFDTGTGGLIARIPVGSGPHGLTVWPQPGRYSLGHTGNMR